MVGKGSLGRMARDNEEQGLVEEGSKKDLVTWPVACWGCLQVLLICFQSSFHNCEKLFV